MWLGVETMVQPKPKSNIKPIQGFSLVQSFYSLEQATQYLNIKYGDNYFTPKSLLQAFIQHMLPCYFFFKNSDAMPLIEPEFSITSDASDEDLNLAGDVDIQNSGSFFDEIYWQLNNEIRDNGLLLQLPQSALVQALIDHATIDNNPPNCFCGALAFNPELSTYQDFNIYMQDWIFKQYGKIIKFTFDDLTIPIKLITAATDIESLQFYVTQEQIQKQHPQIVTFFAEYPKPNGTMELHPTFKISASDLTVLHRDLEQIESTVNNNMATTANELDDEIASLKDQLEQKEREINALQAQIDQQATATPANYALSAENSSYTTPFIDVLNAVIQEFWINYQEHNIPPKQNTIISWIMEHYNLSRAGAKAVEQVARPAKAKTGGIKSLP